MGGIQLLFLGWQPHGWRHFRLPAARALLSAPEIWTRERGSLTWGMRSLTRWVTTLEALKKLDFTLALPGHGRPFREQEPDHGVSELSERRDGAGVEFAHAGHGARRAAKRVDLTSHKKDFPEIRAPAPTFAGSEGFINGWMRRSSSEPRPRAHHERYASNDFTRAAALFAACPVWAQRSCESLTSVPMPGLTITSAASVQAGSFQIPGAASTATVQVPAILARGM